MSIHTYVGQYFNNVPGYSFVCLSIHQSVILSINFSICQAFLTDILGLLYVLQKDDMVLRNSYVKLIENLNLNELFTR
jgi:hypothetical protein